MRKITSLVRSAAIWFIPAIIFWWIVMTFVPGAGDPQRIIELAKSTMNGMITILVLIITIVIFLGSSGYLRPPVEQFSANIIRSIARLLGFVMAGAVTALLLGIIVILSGGKLSETPADMLLIFACQTFIFDLILMFSSMFILIFRVVELVEKPRSSETNASEPARRQ